MAKDKSDSNIMYARDSLTVGHLGKSLTVAHLAQAFAASNPAQGQGGTPQPTATPPTARASTPVATGEKK